MTGTRPSGRACPATATLLVATMAGIAIPAAGWAQDGDGPLADRPLADRLTMTTGTGELGEGRAYEYERGVLVVPQDRDVTGGGTLEVVFHRFRALPGADPDTPPIIHLNGGPGFPGLGPGQLENAGWMEENVLPRVEIADFIVVGQRGIGSSTDTPCEPAESPRMDEPWDPDAMETALLDAARRCREHWEAEGLDLQGFSVVEAAADVAEIVEALGYDRVQIHGGSFGSHWGMAVMRFHPEIVAWALLHGMEGPDHTYDMPGGILAALERVAADAEASGAFEGRIPEGGLIAGFRRAIARAEAAPLEVEVPQGNRDPVTVVLDADDVRGLWSGYTPSGGGHPMRGWPADMIRLAEGDYEGAARAVLRQRFGGGRLPTASFFMLDCGSGISGPRLERQLSDPAIETVGQLGEMYLTLCPLWDADLGEAFRAYFDTDIPTVIVHGDWDTSTPLTNALELVPHFTSSRFVRVVRGTHGALGEAMRADSAFRDALLSYMAGGDPSVMPEVVTLPEPDWVPVP